MIAAARHGDLGGLWGVLAFVALFGGLLGLTAWSARRRRALLAEFAPSLGMDFSADKDVALAARLGRLPLFGQGRDRRAFNVLRGRSDGRDVVVFDYHFRTGSGRSSSDHTQTVASVRFERVDLPRFWMRPQGALDKLAALVGMRDLDFDDDEEFSKRWFLKADDEAATRRLFSSRVRANFTQDRQLHIEAAGGDLIVYRRGRNAGPDQIRALLSEAFRLAELLTRDGTPARS